MGEADAWPIAKSAPRVRCFSTPTRQTRSRRLERQLIVRKGLDRGNSNLWTEHQHEHFEARLTR